MSHKPFVSVIIPTYNRAEQVNAAIRSVFAQSYPNFEVIVVDDGSVDGTEEHVRLLIDREFCGIQKVQYLFQSNQGPSAARNNGMAAARGEWIAFLDSDDIWYPDKLEWQIEAVESFKGVCGACITDARLVNDSGMDTTSFRETGKAYKQPVGLAADVVERLARSFDHFWLTCLLVRTELARQIGGFDPTILFAEDHDFNFRLSLVTSFCYVNKPMVQLDRSPVPSTTRPWEKTEVRLHHKQLILEKWLSMDAKVPRKVRRIIVQTLRQTHSAWANWHLEAGRYEEACDAVAKAITVEVTGPLVLKWVLLRAAPTLAKKITSRRGT